jgi:hypothetical protein
MTRQIGVALGVACLVAILGTAAGAAAGASAVTAFHHAWLFMVGCSLTSGLVLQGIGARSAETADAGATPPAAKPVAVVVPVVPVAPAPVPLAPVRVTAGLGAASGCAAGPAYSLTAAAGK